MSISRLSCSGLLMCLPTLTSSAEITRHLNEYLGEETAQTVPCPARRAQGGGGASWLFGAGIKSQVTGMARQFMLGDDPKEILEILLKLHKQALRLLVTIYF
jgi:RHH-type proline utilization regulon transcriptional repressor/proline dehydrogenase/delta 1-pyrroline-5-carboxylate dehydrogenase